MRNVREFDCRFESEDGSVENHWPSAYVTCEDAVRDAILRFEPGAKNIRVRLVRELSVVDEVTVYGWPRPPRALRSRHIALHGQLSLPELRSLPTISSGHADDLKVDEDGVRVWLSRMTVADGASCDYEVTVERFRASTGQWARWKSYSAARY